MITFYRDKDCKDCDFVQKSLKEMNLAHKVAVMDEEAACKTLPPGTASPLLVVDDEKIQGDNNIIRHLVKLEEMMAEWTRHQSGACFCNEDEEC